MALLFSVLEFSYRILLQSSYSILQKGSNNEDLVSTCVPAQKNNEKSHGLIRGNTACTLKFVMCHFLANGINRQGLSHTKPASKTQETHSYTTALYPNHSRHKKTHLLAGDTTGVEPSEGNSSMLLVSGS